MKANEGSGLPVRTPDYAHPSLDSSRALYSGIPCPGPRICFQASTGSKPST